MTLIQLFGKKALTIVEDIGLFVIAIATIIAFGAEVDTMIEARKVTLADLLLMFIYLEVLSMASIYLQSGKLPIRIPIYIAIVALARFLILDMKSMDALGIIAIAASTLILALTVLAIRFGHIHIPYPKDENT